MVTSIGLLVCQAVLSETRYFLIYWSNLFRREDDDQSERNHDQWPSTCNIISRNHQISVKLASWSLTFPLTSALKAALLNSFILTMDQTMTICNVNVTLLVLTNPKRTITVHRSCPQLYRACQPPSTYCFGFTACKLTVLVHSHCCNQQNFLLQHTAILSKRALNPLCTTYPAPKVSN